jgi:YVTN family beta-propeller protein
LQPDERLLWVGNNAKDAAQSGVTVIDTRSLKTLKHLATGGGHHEIAFSKDSRFAFVTNRDDGTLSIIDIASLTISKQLKTGSHPLSVAYSPLSGAAYVADGKDGTVTVVDAASQSVRRVIKVKQGLGPMGFSEDGRFGIVLNTLENQASVIDAATDSLIHELDVAAEPYQVVFTKAYAYVRGLASPKVTMINLSSLGEGRKPISQGFEAGPKAPRLAGDLPLASSLAVSRDDNAVFVVNPVDNTTYFYAEGMNAPMSGYPNRGQVARAAWSSIAACAKSSRGCTARGSSCRRRGVSTWRSCSISRTSSIASAPWLRRTKASCNRRRAESRVHARQVHGRTGQPVRGAFSHRPG